MGDLACDTCHDTYSVEAGADGIGQMTYDPCSDCTEPLLMTEGDTTGDVMSDRGEVEVGDLDPVSARAHHRGDWLCADRHGPYRCTRPRGHAEPQHVSWSAESGRVLAAWRP